jgi:hypothetical protein
MSVDISNRSTLIGAKNKAIILSLSMNRMKITYLFIHVGQELTKNLYSQLNFFVMMQNSCHMCEVNIAILWLAMLVNRLSLIK